LEEIEMGSSYRSDLNSGRMTDWEAKLRQATTLVKEVISDVWECIGSDGQSDNAADDGGLAERLGIAVGFIEGELPNDKQKPIG
jgi:hypothetical protein